jgi:hypothetical protein
MKMRRVWTYNALVNRPPQMPAKIAGHHDDLLTS